MLGRRRHEPGPQAVPTERGRAGNSIEALVTEAMHEILAKHSR